MLYEVITLVRPAQGSDRAAVLAVQRAAFDGDGEARLVQTLLDAGVTPRVSLLAERLGGVVGHILITPVRVVGPGGERPAFGLSPLAVKPGQQGHGIGAALVRAA